MDRAKNNPHLLPVSVIEAAAGGNVDAINAALKHYEQYISVLATRRLYDENGVPHLCVDDEMRKTLEIKLITRILNFEIIKAA
ncbi:helix-turn-helix domain-containing protein [Intestinimonas butyriciproducens]|uniref:helix-turn-helix domain-containing protein n=1 Tax=Intestinimonas butyriciproducens TaxID=1297617 RepID=UPI00189FE457|nr:helix-turn-helix domain-containing protein [Intestinimonas butyriciproducens]